MASVRTGTGCWKAEIPFVKALDRSTRRVCRLKERLLEMHLEGGCERTSRERVSSPWGRRRAVTPEWREAMRLPEEARRSEAFEIPLRGERGGLLV